MVQRILLAAVLVLIASTAFAEIVTLHPSQTSFVALCDFCIGAEVNVANPIAVRRGGSEDIYAYLAFEFPSVPRDSVLHRAILELQPWEEDAPYPWLPLVRMNYSQGDRDLTVLIPPYVPYPETAPAYHVGVSPEGADQWDVTALVRDQMGLPSLFVLTPVTWGEPFSAYRFEGNSPDGPVSYRPALHFDFRPAGTPVQGPSVSDVKGRFARGTGSPEGR